MTDFLQYETGLATKDLRTENLWVDLFFAPPASVCFVKFLHSCSDAVLQSNKPCFEQKPFHDKGSVLVSTLREFLGTSQISTFGIVLLKGYTCVNDNVLLPKTLDVRADSFLPASLVHIVHSYSYFRSVVLLLMLFFSFKEYVLT